MAYLPITGAETVREIQSRPQLLAAGDHIFMGDACADRSIDALCRENPSWVKGDMLCGLNRLLEIADGGAPYVYPLPSGERVSLVHFPAVGTAPFVLLCAGGAYCGVASMVEAFPIAAKLNEMGYHAFVLEYRSGARAAFPAPMEDLACAIWFILEHARRLRVEPKNYAVCGMSAGGHLAATLAAESMRGFYGNIPMPAAIFLGYPVVTMGEFSHELSRRTLLGESPCADTVEALSIEKQISEHSPPIYLWQCREDAVVPFENSRLLADALRRQGIRHCYRVFDGTAHGWALGTGTQAEGWLAEAVRFWQGK